MKYSKKRSQHEASNVSYNPNTREAYSYGWWKFVKVIDGLTIFNRYSYSNSTCKHQHKVHRLMRELGHNIDLVVNFRDSLGTKNDIVNAQTKAIKYKIATLRSAIAVKGSHKAKNEDRLHSIMLLQLDLQEFYTKLGVNDTDLIFDNVLNKL